MKQTKKCSYCGKEFSYTSRNAKKYCRSYCALLAAKKRRIKNKQMNFLCQWCGEVFTAERRKKFCKPSCQAEYMKKLGILRKTVTKIPVKVTITDVVNDCKKSNITYGRYVQIKKLK